MNGLSEQGALQLRVEDFGPIIEAQVDLRPLTVFVGPSNTGKSYLAILIYALHRLFGGDPALGRRNIYFDYPQRNTWKQVVSVVKDLREAAQSFADNEQLPDNLSIDLPASIAEAFRLRLDSRGDDLGRELGRCFGVDQAGALTRKGQKHGARIVLHRLTPNASKDITHKINLTAKGTELRTTVPAGMEIEVDIRETQRISTYFDLQSPERTEFLVRRAMEYLAGSTLSRLLRPLDIPAYYLPADRTGVMHAHSVVVSALIGNAPMAGLRPDSRTPMLSGVLADFLEQLIQIDHPRYPRRKRRRNLGAGIESEILRGSVRVEQSATINYPHFTYRPDGWERGLPLMNASSMVSELAPVVLYLRHSVVPGNVLIIEEPESHLHPAMQVEFTRQIAILVRAGIRVIVTTHSEWLLEELANIVRRARLPKTPGNSASAREAALRPDEVGVWLFEPKKRPKGSTVREIGLDESGLFPSGFQDVAAALHNDWAEISSRVDSSA